MRDLTYYLHIPYLIVKDLRGELSEEERLTLEQWLDEREDNRQLFEKIHHQKDTRQRDRIIRNLPGNEWIGQPGERGCGSRVVSDMLLLLCLLFPVFSS